MLSIADNWYKILIKEKKLYREVSINMIYKTNDAFTIYKIK